MLEDLRRLHEQLLVLHFFLPNQLHTVFVVTGKVEIQEIIELTPQGWSEVGILMKERFTNLFHAKRRAFISDMDHADAHRLVIKHVVVVALIILLKPCSERAFYQGKRLFAFVLKQPRQGAAEKSKKLCDEGATLYFLLVTCPRGVKISQME